MIIDLKDIKVLKNYSPRKEVNSEAISNYKENYELGDDLPPLIIQKEEKILVDGFHRYFALKELGKETAEVKLLDIPKNEIRAEAIRRNRKHGVRFTKGRAN